MFKVQREWRSGPLILLQTVRGGLTEERAFERGSDYRWRG